MGVSAWNANVSLHDKAGGVQATMPRVTLHQTGFFPHPSLHRAAFVSKRSKLFSYTNKAAEFCRCHGRASCPQGLTWSRNTDCNQNCVRFSETGVIHQSSFLPSPFLNDTVRKIPWKGRRLANTETHSLSLSGEKAASSHTRREGAAFPSGRMRWKLSPWPEPVRADCRRRRGCSLGAGSFGL